MTEADLVKKIRAIGESHGPSTQQGPSTSSKGQSKDRETTERADGANQDETEKKKAEKRKRSSKKSKKDKRSSEKN